MSKAPKYEYQPVMGPFKASVLLVLTVIGGATVLIALVGAAVILVGS